jgi:hypothetical protein
MLFHIRRRVGEEGEAIRDPRCASRERQSCSRTLNVECSWLPLRFPSFDLGVWGLLRISSFEFRISTWAQGRPNCQARKNHAEIRGQMDLEIDKCRPGKALRRKRFVRFRTFPYVLVRSRTISYDLVRFRTNSYVPVHSDARRSGGAQPASPVGRSDRFGLDGGRFRVILCPALCAAQPERGLTES